MAGQIEQALTTTDRGLALRVNARGDELHLVDDSLVTLHLAGAEVEVETKEDCVICSSYLPELKGKVVWSADRGTRKSPRSIDLFSAADGNDLESLIYDLRLRLNGKL